MTIDLKIKKAVRNQPNVDKHNVSYISNTMYKAYKQMSIKAKKEFEEQLNEMLKGVQ